MRALCEEAVAAALAGGASYADARAVVRRSQLVATKNRRVDQVDDVAHSLEPLLELYESQGDGDMPYPPDYPKMPGEPKRVQPSRDRDRK